MRDIPTAAWLIAAGVAAAAHEVIPAPRWLIIHLLLLGAITHAILVWSQYFSFALLRSRARLAERRTQNIRLILANVGALLVLIGVPARVWALTAVGAGVLIVAVVWHGYSLARRTRQSLPGKFGRTIRYYIGAAGFLALGALLGALVARGGATPGLDLAHALVNTLGWMGLTVAGTLVTLWPTVLRTRADGFAAAGAARALPALVVGVLAAAVGAAITTSAVVLAGLALYLLGLVIIAISGWREARQAPPRSFAALSMATAFGWWCGTVLYAIVQIAIDLIAHTAIPAASHTRAIVPFLAAGFAVQMLIGALSYLVPVVLGGGPRPVRAGTAAFDRWGAIRVIITNGALIVWALPVPEPVARVAAGVYLVSVAVFVPIMFAAMRAQRIAKRAGNEPRVLPPPAA